MIIRNTRGLILSPPRLEAQLPGVTQMAAGQRQVVGRRDGNLPRQQVSLDKLGAAREQPAKLVAGNFVFLDRDHFADLFDVFGPISNTPGVRQKPLSGRRFTQRYAARRPRVVRVAIRSLWFLFGHRTRGIQVLTESLRGCVTPEPFHRSQFNAPCS